MLIDTHAHLNFPDYEKDLDNVIKRSLEKGVNKIICASSNIVDSAKAIEIAQKYPKIVYAAVGIHPHQTDSQEKIPTKKQIENLKKLVQKKQVVAIGECGLDFSPAPPTEKDRSKKEQIFLFKKQIKLAIENRLPLIIHSRKALPQVLETLRPFKNEVSGVFHCYSGGKKDIPKVEELGFYFGLDGNLTYDVGLQNVAKEIPLEKTVLETDCPFLSPEPHRGLRNEPKNVKIIAKFLAQIKGIKFEKIVHITSQNAKKLLKI
jgi:TatD DNase family protein